MNPFDGALRLFKKWAGKRTNQRLLTEAEKGAKALDIMLDGREWYGGVRVAEGVTPYIEVLIVDSFPGTLSTFIPPRIGGIPVLVRFGSLPKAI
jgi:hypothetical protein